jgi:NAD(P)-dependent dehydrogenase (short-subunit alcohol dehydrogenase family)
MHNKKVALITGANKGIGLQIAKDLATHNFTVLVGSRDLAKGEAAAKTVAPDAHAIQLDVTNQSSITAAAEKIRKDFGRLDVLVNNAAISHTGKPGTSFDEIIASGKASTVPLADVRTIWDTNVFGVLAVTQAMLPLLREAPSPRIVNVSSTVGSLTANSNKANQFRNIFAPGYAASKTAVNAITLAFAIELENTNIKVNAVCPGYVATDLNNFRGTRTVQQGATQPVRLALLDDNGPTGTYSNEDGPLPW